MDWAAGIGVYWGLKLRSWKEQQNKGIQVVVTIVAIILILLILLIFPLVSVAVRRRHLLKTLINKAETSSSPRSPHIHNPRPPIISEVFFSLPSTGHQQICIDLSASDL